jgi:hypothetical protein
MSFEPRQDKPAFIQSLAYFLLPHYMRFYLIILPSTYKGWAALQLVSIGEDPSPITWV